MFAIGMLTYQVVPLFGVKKNQMSVALAVVVLVTAPPGYLNVPPLQATVRPAVPSFVRIRVNDDARLELALEFDSVKVQFPVSVAVNTLPNVRSMVCAVPVLPSAVTLSEKTASKNSFVVNRPASAWLAVLKIIASLVPEPLVLWIVSVELADVPPLMSGVKMLVPNVGDVLSTTLPEPVDVLVPVPPLATGSVPVTSVVRPTLSVPPRVKEPEEVTVPVRVRPLTVPAPDTLVTVPTYWSADAILKLG
jgi:hypothetical protein